MIIMLESVSNRVGGVWPRFSHVTQHDVIKTAERA